MTEATILYFAAELALSAVLGGALGGLILGKLYQFTR